MKHFVLLMAVASSAFAQEALLEEDLLVAAESAPGPAEAVTSFLEAAHDGDYAKASKWLSLDRLPADQRAVEGPRLARRFMFLLDQFLTIDAAKMNTGPGDTMVAVGELPLGRVRIPVQLAKRPDGTWHFNSRTVKAIDPLFEENGSPLWELLPQWLMRRSLGPLGAWQWLGLITMFVLGWALSRLSSAVLRPLLVKLTKLTANKWDDALVLRLVKPLRMFLFMVAMAVGTRALAFPMTAQSTVDDIVRAGLVASMVWGLLVVGGLIAEALEDKASKDNDFRSARAVQTQVAVLRRVITAIVAVIGGALVLLQFPPVRHVGMSLLASAGVAGVVIGLAAQRTISNLLAGIQIGLTQPMRIGDTVIVENEWGWIEEITLTYVVVKVWDLRRVVLPISYFLEKPFQNWSRTSTEILGTAEVWADYRTDVDGVRAEVTRVVEAQRDTLWNGKVNSVQVTNLTDKAMLLRVLISADDSGKAFDLRCILRERVMKYLQQQQYGVPMVRAELPVLQNGTGRTPADEAPTARVQRDA
ncbi:MAG: mechanosensitive ion channel family protein [Archangium sp.]